MTLKLRNLGIALFFLVLSIGNNLQAQDAKAGKTTFRSKCGSCHDTKLEQKMTGPALKGAVDRWNAGGAHKGKSGEEWMKTWILNWNDAVASGNPYAVKMKDFDASAMTVFTGQISDVELANIVEYIKHPEIANVGTPQPPTTPTGGDANDSSSYTYYIILALLLLLLLAYLLGKTNKGLNLIHVKKEGEGQYHVDVTEADKTPFYLKSSFKSALLLGTILLFIFALGRSAMNLGRQQGYQPTQPIKYSHALHAGKNKIECQYCHFTAADGKHANIPSVSTCMNCHKAVQSGPKYGTKEIAKIYNAVGYDPKTNTTDASKAKPVEWIRIHNLPDHVYFNHSQHVTAGKVECQTCHGPIEKMEEVYQYAPLSMGWCVNCHRNHDVQFVDNAYYKTFQKFHDEMKAGDRKRVTVSDIGGTECQKCHY
jgi:cytochrome c2